MPFLSRDEEIIHGVRVSDPFRWLEDRTSAATEKWIAEQKERCDAYFAGSPEEDELETRVRAYLDIEVVDQPARVGTRYFFRKRCKGQEQGSLYVREIADGSERLLVDPWTETGSDSVGIYRVSPDGAFLAYELTRGGEDRREVRLVDVESALVLPGSIPIGYIRGFVFTANGYFYSHDSDLALDELTILYHQMGSMEREVVVFRVPRLPGSRLTVIGNSCRLGAIWTYWEGELSVTEFWVARPVSNPGWSRVFRNDQFPCSPVLCHDLILLVSESGPGCSKLIELSTEGEELRTLFPKKASRIQQLVIARDRVFAKYTEGGVDSIEGRLLTGELLCPIKLPPQGTVQIQPSYSEDEDSLFYTFESFDSRLAVYEHCVLTNASKLWYRHGETIPDASCVVEERTYPSQDGTEIPLTLVHRSSAQTGTSAPILMTSYGGFGTTLTPRFSVLVTIMMELGAVFAVPHIRGGGEFGKEWHDAGRALNRQNSFDDFIGAARWLIAEGLTTPNTLAIFGGSNSGLLVAAAMTQRPEHYKAVLCIAPLLDMVRYEALDHVGRWRREYGSVYDPREFQALLAYSPYHRIAEEVNYPATMFVSGDMDDRCNPAHVRKMAALLQNRPAQKSPIIVDYSETRGHSPTLPLSVRIQALTRRLVFLCRELELSVPKGGRDETTCG